MKNIKSIAMVLSCLTFATVAHGNVNQTECTDYKTALTKEIKLESLDNSLVIYDFAAGKECAKTDKEISILFANHAFLVANDVLAKDKEDKRHFIAEIKRVDISINNTKKEMDSYTTNNKLSAKGKDIGMMKMAMIGQELAGLERAYGNRLLTNQIEASLLNIALEFYDDSSADEKADLLKRLGLSADKIKDKIDFFEMSNSVFTKELIEINDDSFVELKTKANALAAFIFK